MAVVQDAVYLYLIIFIYIYITLSSTGTCVYILYKTSICVYLTFHVFGQIIATSADVSGLVRIIPSQNSLISALGIAVNCPVYP